MEHIHSQATAAKAAPGKEEKTALATVTSPVNISSAQHSPTQLNSLWWQQQFRPVDLATLPTDDPLLQDGTRRSELFPGQGRRPWTICFLTISSCTRTWCCSVFEALIIRS
jgi:hypothetical protein